MAHLDDVLDGWWSALADEERDDLRALREGDRIPFGYLAGLTRAMGARIGAVRVTGSDDNYFFLVDERLGAFLEEQQAERVDE
jgi:hypothetical protein